MLVTEIATAVRVAPKAIAFMIDEGARLVVHTGTGVVEKVETIRPGGTTMIRFTLEGGYAFLARPNEWLAMAA